MAFVNEYLTPEEMEEFKKKGVVNPISFTRDLLDPAQWTIDRENGMCLIEAGTKIDFRDEYYFVFLWKGETHIVSLIKEYPDEPECVRWSKKAHISKYTFSVDDPFVNDLRNALMVFKFDGVPDELNENSKAICDF